MVDDTIRSEHYRHMLHTLRKPVPELRDFIAIQEELERISIAVETLQLWSERMLATGAIDLEQYNALKKG